MSRPLQDEVEQPVGSHGARFERVSMRFADGTLALQEISFDVRRGEFVTVVGPSGCGKTTLLRITAGLLRASSGRVAHGASDVGYVFQDATLLPWRTVRANVELLCELKRVPKPERRRLGAEAIALVGLGGCEPHEEDGWCGRDVRVGEAVVRPLEPVARCAITTQSPETGERDFDTLRAIKEYRGVRPSDGKSLDFGVFGTVVKPGRVRVGDPVENTGGPLCIELGPGLLVMRLRIRWVVVLIGLPRIRGFALEAR